MKNFVVIGVTIASLMVTGCAGERQLFELKNPKNAVQGSFLVKQDYVATYQRIIQSGKIPTVEGKFALYPEQKIGQVWIEASYGGWFLALLEISPAPNANAQSLVAYSCIESWLSWCKSIENIFQ